MDPSQCLESKYNIVDHFPVWPMNPDNDVEVLLQILNAYSRGNIQVFITHMNVF